MIKYSSNHSVFSKKNGTVWEFDKEFVTHRIVRFLKTFDVLHKGEIVGVPIIKKSESFDGEVVTVKFEIVTVKKGVVAKIKFLD